MDAFEIFKFHIPQLETELRQNNDMSKQVRRVSVQLHV